MNLNYCQSDLHELSQRMVSVLLIGAVGLIVGLMFSGLLIGLITSFLGINAVSLKPTDAFNTYLTVSFLTGIVFALPIFIVQLNLFIRKGLKKEETKILDKVSLWIPPLFIVGGIVGAVVAVYSMQFFQGFSSSIGLEAYWGIEEIISHLASLIVLFSAIFVTTPMVIYFLVKFFNVEKKTIFMGSLAVSPFMAYGLGYITPPDIFSQLAIMLPIYILIILTLLFTKGGDNNAVRNR